MSSCWLLLLCRLSRNIGFWGAAGCNVIHLPPPIRFADTGTFALVERLRCGLSKRCLHACPGLLFPCYMSIHISKHELVQHPGQLGWRLLVRGSSVAVGYLVVQSLYVPFGNTPNSQVVAAACRQPAVWTPCASTIFPGEFFHWPAPLLPGSAVYLSYHISPWDAR